MSAADEPLTAHERTLFALFLADAADAEHAMYASMADGFLTAVISGPREISAAVWVPEIIALDHLPAKSSGISLCAEDAVPLLIRRYNEIARALATNTVDMLLALSDDQEADPGLLFGEMWSFGYIQGMSLESQAWQPLFDDETQSGILDDIYFLATPFLAMREAGPPTPDLEEMVAAYEPLSPQERSAIARDLPDAVLGVYRYWQQNRMNAP